MNQGSVPMSENKNSSKDPDVSATWLVERIKRIHSRTHGVAPVVIIMSWCGGGAAQYTTRIEILQT